MKLINTLLCLLLLTSPLSCDFKKEVALTGSTMGTTYHIKVVKGLFLNTTKLQAKIDQRLWEINKSMSTFNPDSEISRFNKLQSITEDFPISEDFYNVMLIAKKIYGLTDGAWDGTVKQLVNLWGFGNTDKNMKIPEDKEINNLLNKVGFDLIVLENKSLRKKHMDISMNLASIAKGYGVDQIAGVLEENNIKNYLVEIGGEVYASGVKKDGSAWKIGINRPVKNAAYNEVYSVVELSNRAVATSGDYRQFFKKGVKSYSHVIDPRTGRPVKNGVVSASVIANNCTYADGLATALMVMGAEKGLKLVNSLKKIECMIIVANENNKLKGYYSDGF
ncbi:FAD:protein FMN transferase [Candidatus Magnetomoraceae bacterium gMMP-1]